MRPIKFRGIDLETGEYVYGDLIQGNYDEVCPRIKPRKKKARYVKDVAQLVGYDANGNEVYDDDELIDQDGLEYTISDVVQVELFCGGVYEPLYSNRYKFTLKEADQ